MGMRRNVLFGLVVVFGTVLSGCREPIVCSLESLTEDVNSNGFPDVVPPAGVVFDSATNLKVRLINEQTLADLAFLGPQLGVPQLLIDEGSFLVTFSFTLQYGDSTQVLSCTRPLENFEIAFEAACPDDAVLAVEVVAMLEPIGVVARVPVGLTLDVVDYTCGNTIVFRTFVNDSGELDETIDVS